MPSVVGLLEQRELGARRRVDELREEADRIQAELAVAEREWQEWAIARSRVGEVLAPGHEIGQDHAQADLTVPAAEEQTGKTAQVPEAAKAKAKSQVPVWRGGGWPGRRCRWTISASWKCSRTGAGSVKGR